MMGILVLKSWSCSWDPVENYGPGVDERLPESIKLWPSCQRCLGTGRPETSCRSEPGNQSPMTPNGANLICFLPLLAIRCPTLPSRQSPTSSQQYPAHPHPGSTSHTPSSNHRACESSTVSTQPFLPSSRTQLHDRIRKQSLKEAKGTTHRINVLIFTHSTSYSFRSASRICRLLALTSTMKTSVLFSSIFFMADSVLSGCTMTWCSSRRGACGMDLRG